MHSLGNRIIAHARHLGAFIHARDRVALLTVTALDAAQDGRKESWLLQDEYSPIRKSQLLTLEPGIHCRYFTWASRYTG